MRNCTKVIKRLKENEKHANALSYIKELAEQQDLFLAIRHNYMNIYYMGGNLAKVGFDKGGEVYFELHEKYTGKSKGTEYIRLSYDEHKNCLETIKENIRKIAESKNLKDFDGGKTRKKVTREKICQQWIINENNKHNGEWYYVDMEYMIQGNHLGRFDMIAIKKKADKSGKHQVALVELKVGKGAYSSGTIKVLGDSLYNHQTKETYKSYGSGLVGHLSDYMRYLNTGHYETLKEELVKQINAFIELGILSSDSEIDMITEKTNLSDKPEVYFVSFSSVPADAGDLKLARNVEISTEQMRESFYKYMYAKDQKVKGLDGKTLGCSEYAAENVLREEEIKGLLDIKPIFLNTENPQFELEIGQKKYKFHCIFVDANVENSWDCLYE